MTLCPIWVGGPGPAPAPGPASLVQVNRSVVHPVSLAQEAVPGPAPASPNIIYVPCPAPALPAGLGPSPAEESAWRHRHHHLGAKKQMGPRKPTLLETQCG